LSRVFFCFLLQSILVLAVGIGARAQSAETLSQVKKVYVGSFGSEDNKFRENVIEQLRKSKQLEVVATPNEADAIVTGSGSVWLIGYISADSRSSAANRQPVFRGFLSGEITGRNDETLWSYLVTPSAFRSGSISEDLAKHFVAKLIEALDREQTNVSAPPVAERPGEVNLTGAGGTFPAPLYQKWFESVEQRDPKVHITYSAVGSDAGLQRLAEGKADFAAEDLPLSSERMAESKTPLLQFATVVGAVVPVYNLPGAGRSLNFTGEILAEIYSGKIKNWNDPKIRALNRNARLPSSEIAVIHRSDGSGTTFAWTDYLSKVSPEWKTTVRAGTVVNWPVGTGAEGNEAVAALVQQTPNSIGYVELVYALRHQLSFGAVRNAAGQFVQADLESVTAATKGAAGATAPDFGVSISNSPEKGAYPIATFTWWVLPEGLGGAAKKPAFLELLEWMLTSGQNDCSALGYVPLPHEIASRELQALTKLQ
jgi:phosphate transport system substrate-binding protein